MSKLNYSLVIRQLAAQWQLSAAQQQCLEQLGPEAIPQLLAINDTLQQLFAGSPQLATLWITAPNKAFDNLTPMELIEREGQEGLEAVVRFLCLER
jgi:hypothetical protein